ncbi:MAG: hypothetical protein AAGD38_19650, partial [Acidobacteriota bacterium]
MMVGDTPIRTGFGTMMIGASILVLALVGSAPLHGQQTSRGKGTSASSQSDRGASTSRPSTAGRYRGVGQYRGAQPLPKPAQPTSRGLSTIPGLSVSGNLSFLGSN